MTEHQRQVLELRLGQDWSLAEIAEHQATSRAAVHDLLRRAILALNGYEERLGLVAEEAARRRTAAAVRRQLAQVRRRLARLESEVVV